MGEPSIGDVPSSGRCRLHCPPFVCLLPLFLSVLWHLPSALRRHVHGQCVSRLSTVKLPVCLLPQSHAYKPQKVCICSALTKGVLACSTLS